MRRERRVNGALGAVSTLSLVCLALILNMVSTAQGSSSPIETIPGLYAASYFGDDVGGYVLVALVSFVVAVGVTLACVRYRQRGYDRVSGNSDQ